MTTQTQIQFDTPISEVQFSEAPAPVEFPTAISHLVFVYGTLLPGQPNNPILFRADDKTREVGDAVLNSNLHMVDLGSFPGLVVDDQGWHRTRGTVFEVSTRTLAALDYLEGHPRFYRRGIVGVLDGRPVWCYVLQDDRPWAPVVGEHWPTYRDERDEALDGVEEDASTCFECGEPWDENQRCACAWDEDQEPEEDELD